MPETKPTWDIRIAVWIILALLVLLTYITFVNEGHLQRIEQRIEQCK